MGEPAAAVTTGYDEPATERQRGALIQEFTRLGYPRSRAGRARRLADSAALLGIPELSSSTELTKGDTGWLVRILRGCRTPDDLRALLNAIRTQGTTEITPSRAATPTPTG